MFIKIIILYQVSGFSLIQDYTPLEGNRQLGNLWLNKDVNRDDFKD